MDGESLVEIIRRAYDYHSELAGESDRGAAILAAARFEDWLKSCVIECFVELDKDLRDDLFDNGPLSTFSAKINLAFALGLYSKNVLKDLHTVKKIRNEFAHSAEPVKFDNQSISDMCRNLDTGNTLDSDDSRARYLKCLRRVQETIVKDLFDGKTNRRRNGEDST